jgi:hypothetical protein
LAHNVPTSDLTNQGFKLIYFYPYSHTSYLDEFIQINSSCSINTFLCVGGKEEGSDSILLISCGKCSLIFTVTSLNMPNYVNGAYWYFNSLSFGFSKISTINQTSCDANSLTDNNKLVNIIN